MASATWRGVSIKQHQEANVAGKTSSIQQRFGNMASMCDGMPR